MPGLRMGKKCYAASGTPIIRTGRAIAVSIISDLMIVPNRNPGEGLMTEEKIKIGPVCSYSLPVVIKRENCPIWERNTSNTLSPSIVTVFIFIDIVPEMDYVVHRVLTSCKMQVSLDRQWEFTRCGILPGLPYALKKPNGKFEHAAYGSRSQHSFCLRREYGVMRCRVKAQCRGCWCNVGFCSPWESDSFGEDSQYTAKPILVTKSFFAGVVLVRPIGLVILELHTLNW